MRFHWTKTALLVGSLAFAGAACTGDTGEPGATGNPGADGDPGGDGLSALVTVTPEAAGDNCEFGGQKIESGLDDNGDGVLDADEVDSTIYVCNGAPGDSGSDTLVNVTPEDPGENCTNGGQMIETGIDDNDNGVLDDDEVDTTEYVCNGDNLVPSSGESCSTCHGANKAFAVEMAHPDINDDLFVEITSISTTAGIVTTLFSVTDDQGEGVEDIEFGDMRFMLGDIVPADDTDVADVTLDVTAGDTLAVVGPVGEDDEYTLTWTFAAGAFDAADLGTTFHITGTASGNDGYYTIESVTSATTVVVGPIEDFEGAAETFDGTEVLVLDKAFNTDYVEQWAYERSSGSGTFVDLGNGDYSYTFSRAAGSAAALQSAPDYDPSHTQRLFVRVDGRDYGYQRAAGIQDFTFPGTLVDPERVIAPTDGCKKCHTRDFQEAAHAGGYQDTRACVMCHSPRGPYAAEMQHSGAEFNNLIHQIHAAIPMDAFPNRLDGRGYGAVTYPREINDCAVCHTGNEDMSRTVTAGWDTNPTATACGSCHIDVNFITGDNHPSPGGAQPTNESCHACHNAGAITADHAAAATPAVDVPEFNVNLAITAPANSTHYVAGETPMVTVTLTNYSDSSAVNTAFYTTAQGDAGVTSDTALRVASVYVYGPRNNSVPVLATNTMTDPAYIAGTTPTQGHSMFTDSTDTLVESDATGFKYQLLAIPDDMEPGTYMVRVRIGDYGRVGSGDYHIESTAFTTIQIGTATEEKKAAGDACMDCHGTENFLPHNERHSVVFDTDECLSCHDYSGNYGVNIGNRVHAVHSANTDGDLYSIRGSGTRHWEEITFPASPERCQTCHTSGDTAYKTAPAATPCVGCHVESTNTVLDHVRQNGANF